MDCFKAMVQFMKQKQGFEFVDDTLAQTQLKEACAGNANDVTEPFSSKNYSSWAAGLDWGCTGAQIKAAREFWIHSLTCKVCGERVGQRELRDHLEEHNPNARGLNLSEVLEQYLED